MSGMSAYGGKTITNGGATAPKINFTSTITKYEGNTARVNATSNAQNDVIDFEAELGDVHVAQLTGSLDIPVSKVESMSVWDYIVAGAKEFWYGVKVAGATLGNTVVSLLKGVVDLVESLLDVVLMAGGCVVSVFTGIYDLYQWAKYQITGEEYESVTKAMWKKKIMPSVGYSWSDAIFDAAYSENGIFHGMDEYALGPMKYGGTGFGIGEGIGYVAGIIAISVITCGAGGAATAAASTASAGASISATTLSTGLATAAKFGSSMQEGWNNMSEEEKMADGSIGKLMLVSGGRAAIEGVSWYMTYGNGFEKLVTLNGTATNVASQVMSSTWGKIGTLATMQAAKTYADWGLDVAMGSDKTFGQASIEAGTAAFCSVLFNNPLTQKAFVALGNKFDKISENIAMSSGEMFTKVSDNILLDAQTITQKAYLDSLHLNMTHALSRVLDGLGTFTDNVISGTVLGTLEAALD